LTATDDALTGDKTIASAGNQAWLVAELAGVGDGSQAEQLDVGREVVFAHGLAVHESGAQILLVVVAENGDDGSVWRDFVLGAQSGKEVAARRDPHGRA